MFACVFVCVCVCACVQAHVCGVCVFMCVCVCLYCSIIAIHGMYRPVITCIDESVFAFDHVLFNYIMSHATPIIYMTLYLS